MKEQIETVKVVYVDDDLDVIDNEKSSTGLSNDDLLSTISTTIITAIKPLQDSITMIEGDIGQMKTTLNKHARAIVNIQNSSDVIDMPTDALPAPVDTNQPVTSEEPPRRNILDTTLGAVGGVLHGVVDTAAFILESTIDIATLGRAKR